MKEVPNAIVLMEGQRNSLVSCSCYSIGLARDFDPEVCIGQYTPQAAYRLGWRRTSDPRFCPPGKESILICPKCSGEVKE